MGEQIGRQVAEGVTTALIKETAGGLARLFSRLTIEKVPSGPFTVRNLGASQRFYQQQDLRFEDGDYVTRSCDSVDLLENVCSLLRKPRCVGIFGLGGSGKTRLAAEAVARLLPDLPGGALWISVAGRRRFVLQDLLADLGHMVGGIGRFKIERVVRRRLEEMGHTLLVLDNLETVSDPRLFQFVADLPGNCSLLFTTKAWLDQEYESFHQVRLPPLRHEESRGIIVQQARGRMLNPRQEAEILNNCMGNAWFIVALVAATALPGGLGRIVDELRKGSDPSPEGRAFQATHNQLTIEARNVLAALSLFQQIAYRSHLKDVTSVHDLDSALNELRQWGLAQFEDRTGGQAWRVVAGVPSTYAQNLFERTRFEPAYALLFLNLAERLRTVVRHEDEMTAYEQRWEQRDNFLSALEYYARLIKEQPTNREHFNACLRMLRAVSSFLAEEGYWQEIVEFQRQALEAARRLRASRSVGDIARRLGDTYLSRSRYKEAEHYFKESMDSEPDFLMGTAQSKHRIGIVAQHLGQYERAQVLIEEGLGIKQNLLDAISPAHRGYRRLRFEVAYSLHQLAVLKLDMDEYQSAENLARRSLAIKREPPIGSPNQIALTQLLLGQILRYQERYTDAESEIRDNLKLTERIHSNSGQAYARTELGWLVLHVHHKPDEALSLFEESLRTAQKLGLRRHEARVLSYVGELFQHRAQSADAEQAYRKSIEILTDLEDVRDLAIVLRSFACFLDQVGRLTEAIEVQREAVSLFHRMNRPVDKSHAILQRLLEKASRNQSTDTSAH